MKKTPKKIKAQPKIKDSDYPVSVKFFLNNEVTEFKTDDIEKTLLDFPLQVGLLKTALKIEATFNSRTYAVVLPIPRIRLLSVNKTTRGLLAKQLKIGIGY